MEQRVDRAQAQFLHSNACFSLRHKGLTMLGQLFLTVCMAFASEQADDPATNEPSKNANEVVAVMDGKDIRMSDIEPNEQSLSKVKADDREATIKRWRASNLHGFILAPLIKEYAKKHKIEATDAEIDTFNEHMEKSLRKAAEENPDLDFSADLDSNDPEAKKAKHEIGRAMVETWKVSKKLYDEYGGAVIFQQGNPTEPIGAYRKLLEDAEKEDRFNIIDPEVEQGFWAYFKPKGHSVLPKEMADKMFEKPWWEQKPSDLLGGVPGKTERQ